MPKVFNAASARGCFHGFEMPDQTPVFNLSKFFNATFAPGYSLELGILDATSISTSGMILTLRCFLPFVDLRGCLLMVLRKF